MGTLRFIANTSLDGRTADADGSFDFMAPSVEIHQALNDLDRETRVALLGRRMYEVMRYWADPEPDLPPVAADYASIWQGYDKVVFSRTLADVGTDRTRLEREFDPEAVRRLVDATDGVVTVSGPELAAHAFRAGLVDEVHLFVRPVVVGGGPRALPDGVRQDLRLRHAEAFEDGVLHLAYGRP